MKFSKKGRASGYELHTLAVRPSLWSIACILFTLRVVGTVATLMTLYTLRRQLLVMQLSDSNLTHINYLKKYLGKPSIDLGTSAV